MSRLRPGDVSWAPTRDKVEGSRLWDFLTWLGGHGGPRLTTYRQLHRWSVQDLSGFWDAVRRYFDVLGDGFGPGTTALAHEQLPGSVWYPGVRLNYAENVLRHARELPDRAAVVDLTEDGGRTEFTWRQLESQVAALAGTLRGLGVRPGDRVAAVLPNVPEAIVGLLATASIGAVWTINSPDLSPHATLDRIRQLDPVVLIACDGYRFKGKVVDRVEHTATVEAGLPSLRHTLVVPLLGGEGTATGRPPTDLARGARHTPYRALPEVTGAKPTYERVPFDHPLWVLFSSGTTGAPKGIVHGHGGILLESLKSAGLGQDQGPEDRYYVSANTSWMVWNTLANTLASGASVVTYAGSPVLSGADHQFRVMAAAGVTTCMMGAAYLSLVERSGLRPGDAHDLSRLRTIASTGSPLPESTWAWVHDAVGPGVHLGSDSGGTDICSGFIGSNPMEPVHLGELQGPLLGVSVEAWDERGERVRGQVGEMVITRPMPSMPIGFWGDADGSRYAGSYFARWPGVWVQGDWITETEHGGYVVHGRSDATLNRQGVRLGSADIYSALRAVPEVRESMVIGVERPGGDYWMPLFVELEDGAVLDAALRGRIVTAIRQHTSARHVPDEIIAVPGIPMTHALKRTEVPVKRLFLGRTADDAINRGSLSNPEVIDFYIDLARRRQDA